MHGVAYHLNHQYVYLTLLTLGAKAVKDGSKTASWENSLLFFFPSGYIYTYTYVINIIPSAVGNCVWLHHTSRGNDILTYCSFNWVWRNSNEKNIFASNYRKPQVHYKRAFRIKAICWVFYRAIAVLKCKIYVELLPTACSLFLIKESRSLCLLLRHFREAYWGHTVNSFSIQKPSCKA